MNIILFGFKSSGKTFLGRLLSLKLSRPFIDTDEEIEKLYFQRAQKTLSCSDIFRKEGEAFFRALEKEVVFSLKNSTNSVIALGGNALNEKVFPFLSQIGNLLYLKASLTLILKRIEEQKLPAFVAKEKEPFQAMQKLFYEKETLFQKFKAKEISADLLEDPQKLTTIILQLQKTYGSQ